MTAGRTVNPQSVHWCTPRKYVDAVRAAFGGTIDLDPCSNQWSIVDARVSYALPAKDGLQESWNFPTIYVNPPYGADKGRRTTIKNWLYKCAHAHDNYGADVLALVPVATNTRHWKDYVWGKAAMACFLYDTRLRFLVEGRDAGKGAPMSCAMIYWGDSVRSFERVFGAFGAVVDIRSLHGKDGARSSHSYQTGLDVDSTCTPSVRRSNRMREPQ